MKKSAVFRRHQQRMKFKQADFTGIRHGVENLWANQNFSKFVSRFSKAVENS